MRGNCIGWTYKDFFIPAQVYIGLFESIWMMREKNEDHSIPEGPCRAMEKVREWMDSKHEGNT